MGAKPSAVGDTTKAPPSASGVLSCAQIGGTTYPPAAFWQRKRRDGNENGYKLLK